MQKKKKELDTMDMAMPEEKARDVLRDIPEGACSVKPDRSQELWTFQGKTVKPGWFVDF